MVYLCLPGKIKFSSHLEIMNYLKTEQPRGETVEKKVKIFNTATDLRKCVFCKEWGHKIFRCDKFRLLDVKLREEFVKSNNLCLNCLNQGHFVSNCKVNLTCSVCHRKHNTLLHRNSEKEKNESPPDPAPTDVSSDVVVDANHNLVRKYKKLLATAVFFFS